MRAVALAAGAVGLGALGILVFWPSTSLAEAALAHARLDVGVSTSKDPARVAAMLGALGLPAGLDWCAAAVSDWMRRGASDIDVRPPIEGSAGAKALMLQFQRAGRWVSPADLPGRVRIGMVPVWQRGAPGSWTGHTGIVSAISGDSFASIEGNAQGGAVVENTHAISDGALLGMGIL